MKTQQGFAPIVLVIVLAAAIVVGGGTYYAVKKSAPKAETTVNSNTNVQVQASTTASTSGSLNDLIALGGDLKCTISYSLNGVTSNGEVYLSNNRMHANFRTKASGSAEIESHMIKVGNKVYVWTGTQGSMMTIKETDKGQMPNPQEPQAKSEVNLDQKVDYQCAAWTKDESKFTPPSNIKFVDLDAMLNVNINSKIKAPNVDIHAGMDAHGTLGN